MRGNKYKNRQKIIPHPFRFAQHLLPRRRLKTGNLKAVSERHKKMIINFKYTNMPFGNSKNGANGFTKNAVKLLFAKSLLMWAKPTVFGII